MAENERVRVRERDPSEMTPYDVFMKSRVEFHERQNTGQVVVRPEDREYHISRQGKLLYYLNAQVYPQTPLHDWRVFTQSLVTHSGKHRHQGGLVIYVVEGKGYSIVDDERVDWEAGDLLLLPIKKGGVTHQHFNSSTTEEARLIVISNRIVREMGFDWLDQVENAPGF